MKPNPRFCPDCGRPNLRLIEVVASGDEIKLVCTCDPCGNIVYVVRTEGFDRGSPQYPEPADVDDLPPRTLSEVLRRGFDENPSDPAPPETPRVEKRRRPSDY